MGARRSFQAGAWLRDVLDYLMDATTQQKVWTESELLQLPDDGKKVELVRGEIVMSPAGIDHESIGASLLAGLKPFARQNRLGIVLGSSAGYWMKSGNLRSPDVSFIAKERLKGLKRPPKGFFRGAPDLAVEILSPEDSVEKVHEKIVEYFQSEAQLVWVINPEEMIVLVYHSPQPDRLLRPGEHLNGESLLPGFSLPVSDLFEELDF
jgi:Uma2 family endonuclease